MSKVAIVYFTSTGNTEIMAQKIAEGVQNKGNEAELFNYYDFNKDMIGDYDALAFGCSASGAEQLDGEFEVLFNDCLENLHGKRISLFGSYDWGDGEWMRNWVELCNENNLEVVSSLIANLTPDENSEAECVQLGEEII